MMRLRFSLLASLALATLLTVPLRGALNRKYKAPGVLDEHIQLRLEERGADCKWTGTFIGHFVSDDRVEGTWTAGNGARTFAFVLDRADDNDSQPALKPSPAVSAGGWSGTWTREDKNGFAGADVTIDQVTRQSF